MLLTTAGVQTPVNPSMDVVGSTGAADPSQKAATGANWGTGLGSIWMVSICVSAHSVDSGMKVYVVVTMLLIGNDQVPCTPFGDVVGKGGMAVPAQ